MKRPRGPAQHIVLLLGWVAFFHVIKSCCTRLSARLCHVGKLNTGGRVGGRKSRNQIFCAFKSRLPCKNACHGKRRQRKAKHPTRTTNFENILKAGKSLTGRERDRVYFFNIHTKRRPPAQSFRHSPLFLPLSLSSSSGHLMGSRRGGRMRARRGKKRRGREHRWARTDGAGKEREGGHTTPKNRGLM